MKRVILDAKMSPSIIDTLSPETIAGELSKGTTRDAKALAARFSKARQSLESATVASVEELSSKESLGYLEANENACKALLKELLGNGLAEFHYLERVEPGEESKGHVALLREVRFVSAQVAHGISLGLDIDGYNSIQAGMGKPTAQLRIVSGDDFAMPIGAVESPFIELIMQRLTQLFSRIGVEDASDERMQSVQDVITSMRKDFE
jgi:hypothetical protein